MTLNVSVHRQPRWSCSKWTVALAGQQCPYSSSTAEMPTNRPHECIDIVYGCLLLPTFHVSMQYQQRERDYGGETHIPSFKNFVRLLQITSCPKTLSRYPTHTWVYSGMTPTRQNALYGLNQPSKRVEVCVQSLRLHYFLCFYPQHFRSDDRNDLILAQWFQPRFCP